MANQSKPNQNFPLKCRLSHSYEFDAVFDKTDARVNTACLLLLAKPNSLGFNRLGMIVSKKGIPKSVQRSKVKRSIRETFRRTSSWPVLGWDVVVLTRPRLKTQQNLTGYLKDSFTSLTEKLK